MTNDKHQQDKKYRTNINWI